MRVSHYFEWEEYVTGGHAQSVRNQTAAASTTRPTRTSRPTSCT
jgi:hypothetical protein